MTVLAKYEAACAALAEAVTANEVMAIRTTAQALEAVGRAAKNVHAELNATKLRTRAEARLGDMLAEVKQKGLLVPGRLNGSVAEPLTRVKLKEIGIDKKLSSYAQRLSGIGARAVDAMLARMEAESLKSGRVERRIIHEEFAGRNTESRRKLAAELSLASALSSDGRKFPVIYADPPWRRKAGIGDRAYENHYTTQAWDDILAMPVAKRALPDAWLFLWIPRAHLLALHPTEIKTPLGVTKVRLPLAYAVAQAWGFESYSTCFVWTKTDEENPDVHGTGLVVWDQDEILCLFKRGRGLPKPDTQKKVGSNYRSSSTKHSAKPAYYREMINAMTGGLPVLELFAREDDKTVLPPNFFTWGNQSRNTAEVYPADHEIEHGASYPSRPEDAPLEPAPSRPPSNGAGSSFCDESSDIPAFLPIRSSNSG